MVRRAGERSNLFYIGCLIWLYVVYMLVKSGFGVVASILTVFFGIWHFGLRDKFSNEETASAYSVFNENQQAIQGSFTGTQLDSQLRGALKQNELQSSIPTALLEKTKNSRVNENERLRRRNAAALAAEQRLKTQKQQD